MALTAFSYNGCGADVSIGKNIDFVLFLSTPSAEQAEQIDLGVRKSYCKNPCYIPGFNVLYK